MEGVILFHFLGGTKRFGELSRLMPAVTQPMLTRPLRELEGDGIVEQQALAHASAQLVPGHFDKVRARREKNVERPWLWWMAISMRGRSM
jgi:hypothetical protein|nr:winged helix-turn-helix transcriptional regulator [Acidiferrobacter sp. SPIII_3]